MIAQTRPCPTCGREMVPVVFPLSELLPASMLAVNRCHFAGRVKHWCPPCDHSEDVAGWCRRPARALDARVRWLDANFEKGASGRVIVWRDAAGTVVAEAVANRVTAAHAAYELDVVML